MIRRRDTRRLVAALVAHTNELGIDRQVFADALGVTRYTINAWFRHAYLPSYVHAAAWAEYIGLRLAVVLDGRVFSEGADVPSDFVWLRRRQELSQKEVAARANTHRAVISMRERQKQKHGLATVHDHVTLLGYRLTLLHARQAEAVSA
ncbi:hypothetical protein [Microbispora sp. KK1-11]|uniref:hypothetical protein n=1 Tax=Microbispora sp. KK1-11 TaxID=2053005 RepID=UPI00115BCB7D|nr:hypothetical protein [Microbispora sp. KK1-11]TQS29150.1 hypothetical protein FLW16_12470 [Microbispora sp. KK1-11]